MGPTNFHGETAATHPPFYLLLEQNLHKESTHSRSSEPTLRVCDAWRTHKDDDDNYIYELSHSFEKMLSVDIYGSISNLVFFYTLLENIVGRRGFYSNTNYGGRFPVFECALPVPILNTLWVVYISAVSDKTCVLYVSEIADDSSRIAYIDQCRSMALRRSSLWISNCPQREEHGSPIIVDSHGDAREHLSECDMSIILSYGLEYVDETWQREFPLDLHSLLVNTDMAEFFSMERNISNIRCLYGFSAELAQIIALAITAAMPDIAISGRIALNENINFNIETALRNNKKKEYCHSRSNVIYLTPVDGVSESLNQTPLYSRAAMEFDQTRSEALAETSDDPNVIRLESRRASAKQAAAMTTLDYIERDLAFLLESERTTKCYSPALTARLLLLPWEIEEVKRRIKKHRWELSPK